MRVVQLEGLVEEASPVVELAGSGSLGEMEELRGAVEVAAKKEDTREVAAKGEGRKEGEGVGLEEWATVVAAPVVDAESCQAWAGSEVRQEGSEVRQKGS